MTRLRFAILGTGFGARYQLAGWRELPGAQCVGLGNRTRAKAQALGDAFGIAAVYDKPEELLAREKPDFVDIITEAGRQWQFVELAAAVRGRWASRRSCSLRLLLRRHPCAGSARWSGQRTDVRLCSKATRMAAMISCCRPCTGTVLPFPNLTRLRRRRLAPWVARGPEVDSPCLCAKRAYAEA